jgi:hypothetical protein
MQKPSEPVALEPSDTERLARIEQMLTRQDERYVGLAENLARLAEAHNTLVRCHNSERQELIKHVNKFSREWDSLFKTTQELVDHSTVLTERLVEAFNLPETKSKRAAAKTVTADEKKPETSTALKH